MAKQIQLDTNPDPNTPATVVVDTGNPEGTPTSDGQQGATPNPGTAPVAAPVNTGDAASIAVPSNAKQPSRTPSADADPTSGAPAANAPRDNAAFAAMRVENKQLKDTVGTLQHQMSNITQALQNIGNPNVGGPNNIGEPIEKRLVEDPVGVIREIAVSAFQEANSKQAYQNKVAESRKIVLEKYPQLTDPNSREYQVYNKVCTENPDYFNLGNGPMVAMRDMEDILAREGNTSVGGAPVTNVPAAGGVNPNPYGNVMLDPNRNTRVNSGILMKPNGIQITPGGPVDLDPAQMEYCKKNNISPDVYKQIINKGGKGGYTA